MGIATSLSRISRRARAARALAASVLCVFPLQARAAAPACSVTSRVPFTGLLIPTEPVIVSSGASVADAFPALTFQQPLFLTAAPDGSNRLFVVEKEGRIRVFNNSPAANSTQVFLDLSSIVRADGEGGLLGLAFDPNYATNGYFYVSFTTRCPAECHKVVRYRVSSDPTSADPSSALELLRWDRPFSNHNGGMLAFGPDGFLYASSGDGGSGGDPLNNGQNFSTLLGKLLRIDPNGGTPYAIPVGNPFRGMAGRAQEILHFGLRNPWRFSFDRATGDLWIGDVGQNAVEEVDYLPVNAPGGRNFGWSVCEGTLPFQGRACAFLNAIGAVPPVFEYANPAVGRSVTGGYVYRGTRAPALQGLYIFGDYHTGTVSAFNLATRQATSFVNVPNVSSFGEDAQGELYAISLTQGKIYAFMNGTVTNASFPLLLSQTGVFANTAALVPAPGMQRFEVNSPLWSDGAVKTRYIGLPPGGEIRTHPTRAWDFPVGTTTVKHFKLPVGGGAMRRVETRVFVRQRDDWVGHTYRWNTEQTEAVLVTAAQTATITANYGSGPIAQTYRYPGPSDCLGCHNAVEGRVLGFRTRQLNRDFAYASGADNQLHALSCMGYFEGDLRDTAHLGALVDPNDVTKSLNARARSYMAVNCAVCHQPTGPAPGNMDFRLDTLLGELNAVNQPVTETGLKVLVPTRIVPGSRDASMVWQLQRIDQPAFRMPRDSQRPDLLGVVLSAFWIDFDLARGLDSDSDGVLDTSDNCPRTPNAGQARSAGSGPGNACLCGDVDLNGSVDANDAVLIRAFLNGDDTAVDAAGHRHCANADAQTGRCSAADALQIEQSMAVPQTCADATALRF